MTSRTGLAVALAASITVALLPELPQPAPDRPFTVATTPGNLPDGTPYTPLAFLDDGATLGVAQDAATLKLLLRPPGAPPVTLRALPVAGSPRIIGLTATARATVWAEADAVDTTGVARIWRAGPRGEDPTLLTTDTGKLVATESTHDVEQLDDKACWAATLPTTTEIRCVPLSGGPVSKTPLRGVYALAGWPWATESEIEKPGSTHLVDVTTGERRTVRGEAVELIDCTAAWCRVQVLRQGGTAHLDLLHPSGAPRLRVGPGLRPAVPDVVLHDRYAPLFRATPDGEVLCVHDTATNRLVDIATGTGTVLAGGSKLWWSTGANTALTWHVLDLTTLAAGGPAAP
ncbi:hypothetical protein GCM10023148_20040 [Actinokineospora soli]